MGELYYRTGTGSAFFRFAPQKLFTTEDTKVHEKVRPLCTFVSSVVIASVSLAADDESVDANGGRSHGTAELQIISDFRDVEEHVFQIAGDGDLLDGIRELASRDPHAGGAARIIAGDEVGAVAEEFRDIQAFFDFADDLLRSFRSGLKKVIAGTDAGI